MKNQAQYIWLNGKFIPFAKAKIHLLNHSLHYGSAVFEGVRCYDTPKGPAVFRLKEHVDRLFHSAKVMGMKIPYSQKTIIKTVGDLIKKNKLKECYVRPIIFYGEKMGLSPIGAPLYFAIAAWPWGKYLGHDSVRVHISKYIRIHPKSSEMTAKISGHYANSIIASLEASKSAADEALLLDYEGSIAEGPGENIFFVKGNDIFTPGKGTILPGITRDSVIKIARDLGYKIIEKKIKAGEIKNFDEAFFVGTAAEISTIGRIDKCIFKKKPEVASVIQSIYDDAVRGKIGKYDKWLAYVK
ncbi:MAG: branched-chain amino acid transaminase [Parcubacteria group bacterium]|jgi:branched-chain amino acid aminotransferase